MTGPLQLTARPGLVVCHDLVATALAIVLTFYIRFEGNAFGQGLESSPAAATRR